MVSLKVLVGYTKFFCIYLHPHCFPFLTLMILQSSGTKILASFSHHCLPKIYSHGGSYPWQASLARSMYHPLAREPSLLTLQKQYQPVPSGGANNINGSNRQMVDIWKKKNRNKKKCVMLHSHYSWSNWVGDKCIL